MSDDRVINSWSDYAALRIDAVIKNQIIIRIAVTNKAVIETIT